MTDLDEITESTEIQRRETQKWARSMSETSSDRPTATSVAAGGKRVYTIEDAIELIGGFGAF